MIGFAICNFLAPLIMFSNQPSNALAVSAVMPLIGILIGSMAGQCGLLAIWGVLGPFRAPARIAITVAIGVFLMASFGVGGTLADPSEVSLGMMMCAPLFLPLFLLAVQLPLWIFRLVTGGRIIHVGTHIGQSTTPRRQFGLQHVMGGTVVAAVALSLASSGLLILDAQGSESWIPLLAARFYCTVVSTFATLPCLWAGMIARNKQIATGIVAIYTLLIILGLLSCGAITARGVSVVVFFIYHATLMAVILGTLHVARFCGYTFIGWRGPQPNLQTGCPFAVQDDSCGGTQAAETPATRSDEPTGPFD